MLNFFVILQPLIRQILALASMKRFFITVVLIGLVLTIKATQPYYWLGESNKTVSILTAEVTKLLLKSDFEVLGMYHPDDNKNLGVIVFTCDELTSMATSVADKGAFGAMLKIGVIGKGKTTKITFLNPYYVNYAYYGTGTNKLEALKMTSVTDSLVKNALQPLLNKMEYYGRDIPNEELKDYQFLPTMPRYEDVIELNEFDEYLEAVATIKTNLLKGVANSQLVYELAFHDKEITVFGVSFNGKDNPDQQMLDFMGVDCITSMPVEILVQGQKAYMLSGRYRIPLFNNSLRITKIFKIIGLSADINDRMEEIVAVEE